MAYSLAELFVTLTLDTTDFYDDLNRAKIKLSELNGGSTAGAKTGKGFFSSLFKDVDVLKSAAGNAVGTAAGGWLKDIGSGIFNTVSGKTRQKKQEEKQEEKIEYSQVEEQQNIQSIAYIFSDTVLGRISSPAISLAEKMGDKFIEKVSSFDFFGKSALDSVKNETSEISFSGKSIIANKIRDGIYEYSTTNGSTNAQFEKKDDIISLINKDFSYQDKYLLDGGFSSWWSYMQKPIWERVAEQENTEIAISAKDETTSVLNNIQSSLESVTNEPWFVDVVIRQFGDVQDIQNQVGGGGKRTAMPKAVGMDYVPYDGFLASLHQGEAILTKQQAEGWRNSERGYINEMGLSREFANAVTSSLNGASVILDGQSVGQLVLGSVNRGIQDDAWKERFS